MIATQSNRSERGYVLFTTAGLMIGLFAFAGFVVDIGMFEFQKRKLQAAADAGALAAAHDRLTGSEVVTSGTEAVALNGLSDGKNGVQVTVKNPPASGAFMGDTRYTEVIVSREVPTIFLRVLNRSAVTVTSRSVAGPGSSRACVWVLDPTASAAFEVSGSADVILSCGVLVNSSSADAVKVGNATCLSAESVGVVGGYTNTGRCALPASAGMPHFSDPLASLPAPSVGGCTETNFRSSSDITINPGVYCGGIRVQGGTLRLNPGMYILAGGGLEVRAGATVVGQQVTFYNTAVGGYSFEPVNITGNPQLELSAPTSGTYEGILFFQDRSVNSGGTNRFLGSNSSKIEGAIYMATGELQFSGNSDAARYTSFVVNKLQFSGSTSAKTDSSWLPGGSPLKVMGIAE